MPIYEYSCQRCGNKFELLVRANTRPDCPDCLCTELTQKLSLVSTAA